MPVCVCLYAPGHEHKLLSLSGVNAPGLLARGESKGLFFRKVSYVIHMHLF